MKKMLVLIGLLAMFIPETSAIAGDASPYAVGATETQRLICRL
jgi:hypothetical protein